MTEASLNSSQLSSLTTEELKSKLLALTKNRDADSLNAKVSFYKTELAAYFEELSTRNPYPIVAEQVPLVLGVWTSYWSTIPFQDLLPGRVEGCSYQIFGDQGYYGNIARYAPGRQFRLLEKFSSLPTAYDLMVLQSFEVREEQWCIQNVGIEQAFRRREDPLTIEKAKEWFTTIVTSRLNSQKSELPEELELENLDRSTAKKFKTAYRSIPQFEHLYIDPEFRLVRTQREAKQRPSYTIALCKN